MTATVVIPRPANELNRLAALRRYQLLDTPAAADFDYLAKMAAVLCGTPYAFISLVDRDRVWYKAAFGCRLTQTERDADYCAWTILEEHSLYIADLCADARTAAMLLTVDAPRYRMYCGVNLISSDGHRIGTLCVLDVVTRQLSKEILGLLTLLAQQVMALIEQHALHQSYFRATH